MTGYSWHRRFLAFVPLAFWCAAAGAATTEVITHGVSKKQPVLLTANEVGYDSKNAVATAIGKVEVIQGDTILLADRLTYNQNTDVVHAIGHVSILEPTGDVFFSDDATLRDQLAKGVVQQFQARLHDNSLFAAREAQKLNKNVTVMHDAVYSPCQICAAKAGETQQPPLWQAQARTVTLDETAQRVYYRDAWMDVYGVPVAYTPYFSHPTPDAPSQSGLLQPQYLHSTNLGNVEKEPVYLSFAPNMDATITPWDMSLEKPLLQGEFRQLTTAGQYIVQGAITDTYARDALGNIIPGDETRGYIDAHGKLQLSTYWDAGIDAERTTDDTFLQLYGLGWQDLLTSRLYAERIEDRSYFVVESLAFQGLEPQDIGGESPYILPQANLHFESDPLTYHSRLEFDSNALVLTRQQGESDQRLSSTAAWKLPYITPGGQVFEATASMRGDAYNVNDQLTDPTTGDTSSGSTGRVIPQVDLDWRYPFINRFSKGDSLMIAPVAELTDSPNLHTPSLLPNEDSQVAELSDLNLFSPDRFSGLDQIELGPRGAYGMRGQLQFADKEYLEWLLGQAYQQNENSPFPIANAAQAHFSDYIGHLALKYKWLDVGYSFRVDRDSLALTANEVIADVALAPLSLEADFISLQNDPYFGNEKEVFGSMSLELSPHWTWTASGREDLDGELTPTNAALPVSDLNPLEVTDSGAVGLGTGLVFHNECVTVNTTLGRSYISELDVKPSTTIAVIVTLKNFGTPGAGPNSSNASAFGDAAGVDAGAAPPATTNAMQNNGNTYNANTYGSRGN